MDTCYHKHKLFNETDATYDYYSLHMFGTHASYYPWRSSTAYVYSQRASGTMHWHDWDPGADLSTNCTAFSIGVAAFGAGLNFGHQACETWDITKYTAAGQFSNTWRKAFIAPPPGANREAAFVIAIKAPQGTNPTWSFSWDWTVT